MIYSGRCSSPLIIPGRCPSLQLLLSLGLTSRHLRNPCVTMTDCTCQKTFRHGGVSGRRICESLENKPNPRSPLSKGMPNHNQMSAQIVGLRRLHAENPQFSVMPSGEAPYQVRFCQRTSVALLNINQRSHT